MDFTVFMTYHPFRANAGLRVQPDRFSPGAVVSIIDKRRNEA